MDNLKIVPMEQKHCKALAEIEKLSFSQPWSEKGLMAELKNETAHFFTAESDGKVIGYIGLHTVCGEGYIANIAVHPNFRRKGAARRLLLTAEGFALGMGLAFLSLEVRSGNTAACALYLSEGFKEEGRRTNFYKSPTEDALILTLRFTE